MVIDIIILIFILASVFVGYKKGFVDTVIRLAGGIVAIIIAFMLKESVAEFINENTGINKQIADGVKTSITNMLKQDTNKEKSDGGFLTSALFEKKYQEIKDAKGKERQSKVDQWSNSIANFIVKGISFVAIFIAISIIITIIRLIMGGITELPVLKELDGLAGLGVGLILGVIELLIIFSIISFLSPIQIMAGLNRLIENSTLAKFIYNNNFLVTIIAKKIL